MHSLEPAATDPSSGQVQSLLRPVVIGGEEEYEVQQSVNSRLYRSKVEQGSPGAGIVLHASPNQHGGICRCLHNFAIQANQELFQGHLALRSLVSSPKPEVLPLALSTRSRLV